MWQWYLSFSQFILHINPGKFYKQIINSNIIWLLNWCCYYSHIDIKVII
jgi:hypothetical protein